MASGVKRPPSPYPARSRNKKKVRFADEFAPSQIKLKIVCGPANDPRLTIIIRLGFSDHHRPSIKLEFKRGRPPWKSGLKTADRGRTSFRDERARRRWSRESRASF
ncbi:hypothetical protein ANO11243_058390 [Dothideomycetidae sp. 11243]|nr:hypothetical protein ANO11243_058390 [fungal sp. No.11243]